MLGRLLLGFRVRLLAGVRLMRLGWELDQVEEREDPGALWRPRSGGGWGARPGPGVLGPFMLGLLLLAGAVLLGFVVQAWVPSLAGLPLLVGARLLGFGVRAWVPT